MVRHNRPVVAYLRMQHDRLTRHNINPIYANDDFTFGRPEVEDAFNVSAPNISTHHLRIRCVMYEEDEEKTRVAPMVYVRVVSKNAVRLTRLSADGELCTRRLSSADVDVLLNQDDTLQLSPSVSVVFRPSDEYAAQEDGLNETQKREFELLRHYYEVTSRRLGVGGNASVFVAIHKNSQRQLACKVVPVPFVNPNSETQIRGNLHISEEKREVRISNMHQKMNKRRSELTREYSVLKDLSHPNIVALEKVLYTQNNIYIFQELITGGDLLSYMDLKGVLGEPQAAVIVRQILKAVDYFHDNGIVHRDIKPENVLMTSWRDGARVVLTDFGQARTIDDAKAVAKSSAVFRMQSLVGTIGYTAPEVLRQLKRDLHDQGYSKAIDIWSVGCIAAVLLTGELLCPDQPDADDVEQNVNCSQFSTNVNLSVLDTATWWQRVGRKAKAFVRGCAAEDEAQRLTAKRALLHEWFTNRHYAADLEAAYRRAIADWTPREENHNVIEFVDAGEAPSAKRVATTSRSHHFAAPPTTSSKPSLLFNTKKKANAVPIADAGETAVENTLYEAETIHVPPSPPLPSRSSMQDTSLPYFVKPTRRTSGLDSTPCPPPFSLPQTYTGPSFEQLGPESLLPPPPGNAWR